MIRIQKAFKWGKKKINVFSSCNIGVAKCADSWGNYILLSTRYNMQALYSNLMIQNSRDLKHEAFLSTRTSNGQGKTGLTPVYLM